MLPIKKQFQKWERKGKNKMKNGKQLTLNIYNEKNEREYEFDGINTDKLRWY